MNKFAKCLSNMCTNLYHFKELNIEFCSLQCCSLYYQDLIAKKDVL